MDKTDFKNLMKEVLKEEMVVRVSDASDMYTDGRKLIKVSIEFDGVEIDSDVIDL
ncbi:hypothetical protein IFU39_16715 [Paenibacillus sp. CFBP 13594]|uniref:hypothetical protein n=1 Tax=Paenibacillus sp. CFBP 13594 TaxID=2774037 RepID=UPI00177FEF4C|nr:hypothetical protein [Paenibacillus sp. CFBP 13594]MBD8839457.1 hypothetical protein [Paenibacillus sp. CFBP 13594]